MGKHNSMTLVLGMSGMGKSWMMGYLAEASDKQRIILDPKNEHQGLADFHFLADRSVLAAAAKQRDGWTDIFRKVLGTQKSVRIQVHGLDYEEYRTMMDGLARAMHERGHLFFMADEYHRVAPNGRVPRWVQVLHSDARSQGIDGVIGSQRPALLDTTVVSQPNRRITFKMEDENDLKRTQSLFRPIQGRRVDEVISNLKPRECLYINADTSEQELIVTTNLTRNVQHHG